MSEQVGTVVAQRYELSEVIGKGGQGVVYQAHDRNTGQPVAIKMVTGPAARDKQFVERLRRELEIMQALAGTCAVSAIDLCVSPNGYPCLVMERLVGTDLEGHVRHQRELGRSLALREVVELLEPVVVTLERAHAAGIIHRDLKPANVFLLDRAAGGGVRLLDFGMAKLRAAAPLTAVGTVLGSPAYMAPEVWQGHSERIDARADVYSLAVLVYRVLGGELPFDAPTLAEQLRLVTTSERPSLRRLRPDLPDTIDAWVARGLAVDPNSRFADVRVMWDALRLCADSKRRGLFGFGPKKLASAWKVAKAAVDRLTGHAADDADGAAPLRGEPTHEAPESGGAQSERDLAESVARQDVPKASAVKSQSSSDWHAPSRPSRAETKVSPAGPLPFPKLPPPPPRKAKPAAAPTKESPSVAPSDNTPPRKAKPAAAPTLVATPKARDEDDAKTLLYVPKSAVAAAKRAAARGAEPAIDSSVKTPDGTTVSETPTLGPDATSSVAKQVSKQSARATDKAETKKKAPTRKKPVSAKKSGKKASTVATGRSNSTTAKKASGSKKAGGGTTGRKKPTGKKSTSKKSTKKKSSRSAS